MRKLYGEFNKAEENNEKISIKKYRLRFGRGEHNTFPSHTSVRIRK